MSNILVFVPSIDNSAPVKIALNLAEGYVKRGNVVDVCYLKNIDDSVDLSSFSVFRFKVGLFNRKDYDVVHAHMMLPTIISAFFFPGTKKISTIHSDIKEDLKDSHGFLASLIFSNLWIFSLSLFDKNVVLSDYHKNIYDEKLNLKVIPNSVSVNREGKVLESISSEINNFKGRNPNKHVLVSTSAFRNLKGLEQIIKLLDFNDKFICIFFGDGPVFENIQKLAEKFNVLDRCLFLSRVKHPFLYFNDADVFVFPSRSEGFPLAILEAVREKIPIVASDIKPIDAIFSSKIIKFSLDNIESFNDSVNRSIFNVGKTNELYEMFINNYTSEIVIDNYLLAIDEVLNMSVYK